VEGSGAGKLAHDGANLVPVSKRAEVALVVVSARVRHAANPNDGIRGPKLEPEIEVSFWRDFVQDDG
jgi:hypothetical protein